MVQWNPSIMNTIGNQHFVPFSVVSLNFPVDMYSIIGLLSTTWLRFQSLPLLYASGEDQAKASTMSNSTSLMSSC